MLTQLSISNIVLIEQADLAFGPGLCVLSGETGAGKSILLDALGLVLGGRADASLVRRGQTQGQVTAQFDVTGHANVAALFSELELEASDDLIIRRTIGSDGKNRIHVNDVPTTLATLKKLGDMLVEIHGQHDQRSLASGEMHRDMLDEYGGLAKQRAEVREAYLSLKTLREQQAALVAEIAQAERERDFLEHMHKELENLSPEPGEEDALTEARTRMMGSEKLFELLAEVTSELEGKGAIAGLRSAHKSLVRSPLTSGYSELIDALDAAANHAELALDALEKIASDAQFSPEKLERTEERLFALKAAARKYHVPVSELPALCEQTGAKLALLSGRSQDATKLASALESAKKTFVSAAGVLSEKRKAAAEKLAKSIARELAPLKMEGTRFRVHIEALAESGWSEAGMDAVNFECATNVAKNDAAPAFAPLSKIASGGELSRFMLALKVALSSVRSTPTLIFDEIDTGTGGAVADAIGKRLAALGESAQVLVVTHLPQVAARGSQHLLVSKQTKGTGVLTRVDALSATAREEELARMLAGATVTDEARKAARKLMEDAA